eukprot:CAMPEP_0170184520 /NCGR_PEP_ID=MMETSP0040_2-20121228/33885_1 /TAXON_ID=641309 /ORGANISM="Lotharella oceanica, Strain CCMP622" /LENGTH=55 /DNA_ID=CAMNT_0010430611 /DNA_START=539 /DNA_END=706 /DNA_ORIENTATION=+
MHLLEANDNHGHNNEKGAHQGVPMSFLAKEENVPEVCPDDVGAVHEAHETALNIL